LEKSGVASAAAADIIYCYMHAQLPFNPLSSSAMLFILQRQGYTTRHTRRVMLMMRFRDARRAAECKNERLIENVY
jgi:hypothetical protein